MFRMQLLISWQHACGMWVFILIKVGKLQLSVISLSEKKNCMEKLKVEERKWSSCHEHLHVRVASHTSVNQKALRECFLSWHFGSLSLPVAVHLCIHGQSWSGFNVLKAWGKFSPGLRHDCKVFDFAEVTFSSWSPSNWGEMPEFSPEMGEKLYFFILWVFLSFLFGFLKCSFVKRRVVGTWSLSSFWYLEGWTVHFQKEW